MNSSAPDNRTLIDCAREIATRAHAGQFRRDGVTPYIQHPEAVAGRVSGDPIAEAAAWLHDVLEDTGTSAEDLLSAGMSAEVVEVVQMLTHNDSRSYENYLAAIAAHPVAKKVKIADMLTNLSDKPTNRQIVKYAKGLLVLLR